MISKSYFHALSFLLIAGCSSMCEPSRKDLSPEAVVEAYLDVALNMSAVDQKQELLDLSTGNLKSALERASKDTVMDAFINKNYQLESYSVIERRDRTPRETEITFQIAYRNLGKPAEKTLAKDSPLTTTENTVSVKKEQGLWLIDDVLGKKTNIDFPISKSDEITPSKP